MREFPESLGLGGSLLIAHPNLLDPNFRRTVLFISAHDAQEGSFGFVLNRTTDKNVSEFFPDRELDGLANVPVFIGGPVSPDQLMFVAFQSNGETISCRTHLSIDEARGFVEEDVESVRAFIGYAGWSEGQLEAELAQKAWLVQKPDREILDLEKCKAMWPTIMREQGPWFRLLAAAPDDPSRN